MSHMGMMGARLLVALLGSQASPPGPPVRPPALAGYVSSTTTLGGADNLLRLPPGLRLLTETLRVPFGDDWGGEMRTAIEVSGRLSFGAFMKVWSEGVCDPHWCAERSIHMGVDAQFRVTPNMDLNLGYEGGKGTSTGRGPMLRARWKF